MTAIYEKGLLKYRGSIDFSSFLLPYLRKREESHDTPEPKDTEDEFPTFKKVLCFRNSVGSLCDGDEPKPEMTE